MVCHFCFFRCHSSALLICSVHFSSVHRFVMPFWWLVWYSGNGVGHINEVKLHPAWLALGLATTSDGSMILWRVYDPLTGLWSSDRSMILWRVYDPLTGLWSSDGSMILWRVYDPLTGLWSQYFPGHSGPLSLAISPQLGALSTGGGFVHRCRRNGELCVTVGLVTRTAGIPVYCMLA